MRIGRTPSWLFAMCMATAGCQLANNGVHNLAYEAKLAAGDVAEHCRYQKLAATHWSKVEKCESGKHFSHDYAKGFKDGFVDFVEFGGTGQPPDLPPRHYWGPHYRTPEGYQAIEDWYAGFRHGAAAGQASGQRQFATVPSPLAPDHSAPMMPAPELPPAEPHMPPIPVLPPADRQAPPAPALPPVGRQAREPIRPSVQAFSETAQPELAAPKVQPASAKATLAPPAANITSQAKGPQTTADPPAPPVVAPRRLEIGNPIEVKPVKERAQTLIFAPPAGAKEGPQVQNLGSSVARPTLALPPARVLATPPVMPEGANSVFGPPNVPGAPDTAMPARQIVRPSNRGWISIE
jgi:hypothetical protein